MNNQRDKFLAELIGGFWHKSVYTGEGNKCTCGNWWSVCMHKHPDFSTWEGFGKLLIFCQQQDWWSWFVAYKVVRGYSYSSVVSRFVESLMNPDGLADAVYEYLNEGYNG